jgi:hypothetical protein
MLQEKVNILSSLRETVLKNMKVTDKVPVIIKVHHHMVMLEMSGHLHP